MSWRPGSRSSGTLVAVCVSVTLLCAAPAGAAHRNDVATPRFVDESATSGLDHVYRYGITDEVPDGGFEFVVGGGLAVLDCDDDGRPDLYLAGGSGPAALYRNETPLGGSLRFTRQPDETTDLAQVSGAYPLDVDSDGKQDLVALRHGENVLLRGLGECRFERGNEALGLDPGNDWTTAFSATWEPGAKLPTLAFGSYQATDQSGKLTAGCGENRLFEPAPDATGYGTAIALAPGWCTLSMLFSDWDRSGRRDLRISNDRELYVREGQEQLWRIAAGQSPTEYTKKDGWERVVINGMGIASHDLDGDSYPEVYLTSMFGNRLETLARGPDRPTYTNAAEDYGVASGFPVAGRDKRPSTSWHPEFQDVNNDGLVDLFVTKGNVEAMPDRALADPSSLMLGTPSGRFVERSKAADIIDFASARGGAVVDLDLDGLLDIVEVNLGEPAQVWRNVGAGDAERAVPMGHWLALRLAQSGPNPDAVGAWIEVKAGGRTQRRELTVGGGHIGGQAGWTHFGLGDTTQAKVRVQWPDGTRGPWQTGQVDGFWVIERGADTPTAWEPGPA
jgi:hypothetical protein